MNLCYSNVVAIAIILWAIRSVARAGMSESGGEWEAAHTHELRDSRPFRVRSIFRPSAAIVTLPAAV